ncbi:LPXTG cell wall anchor domain-containing protein [Pseudarthrobacter sp. J1763]|uniref:LPXTG cell wall anchor domain-containing protein n=1 Tax=Pseudarthrobacter sp. J1763 TaxID=3420445 RepID=UPI003D2ADE0D
MQFFATNRRAMAGRHVTSTGVRGVGSLARVSVVLLGLALSAGSVSAAAQPPAETTTASTIPTVTATPTATATASATTTPADATASASPSATATSASPSPTATATATATTTATAPATKSLLAAPALAAAASLSCAAGTVYTLNDDGKVTSINTSSAAATAAFDFGNDSINGLAISQGGTAAYSVSTQANNNNNVVVRHYNPAASPPTTKTVGVLAGSGTFVMGGINPKTGIYYFGRVNGARELELYAFNTASDTPIGFVGKVAGTRDSGGNARANGDLVFGSNGDMYFVVSSGMGWDNSNVLMKLDGTIPSTQQLPTSTALTATRISFLQPNDQAFNGIAFDGGYLYLDTTQSGFYKVNPSDGSKVDEGTLSVAPVDMASCQYNNSLNVTKNIVGRAVPTDQFQLTTTANGTAIGSTGLTAGTDTGLQGDGAEVSSSVPLSGTAIVVSESSANGTVMVNYTSTYQCTTQSGTVVASGTGTSASFTFPAQITAGVNVECVFTNTPKNAKVTVKKTWNNAIAGDTASFTALSFNGTYTAPASGTGTATVIDSKDVMQGTTIDVAETLGTNNKGSYTSTLVCKDSSGTVKPLTGTGTTSGSLLLGNKDVTCEFTNSNTAASVTVSKNWIVDGIAYNNGSQPAGLSASLTLTGPGSAGASTQAWGTARTGYFVGQQFQLNETTTIDPSMNCTVTQVQLSKTGGAAAVTLPYTDTVAAGANGYTLTNTVVCKTQLVLLKHIDTSNPGSIVAADFTIKATPASGTALQVTGAEQPTMANTKDVAAGTVYTLSESAAANRAYLQLKLQRYTGSYNADGSLTDANAWTDVTDVTATVAKGKKATYRFVNGNPPAYTLPLTGGTGTASYTLIGGGLLLIAALAGLWFILRRRKG